MGCAKTKTEIVEVVYIIKRGPIIKIESLKNVAFGKPDTILVTFTGGSNGCFRPHHLEATYIRRDTIAFKAFYIYKKDESGPCTHNFPEHQIYYIVKADSRGTYIYKADESYIQAKTVVY